MKYLLCRKMERTGYCFVRRSKPDSEGQTLYGLTHAQNLQKEREMKAQKGGELNQQVQVGTCRQT